MLFFRIIQHLLPRSLAFRTGDKVEPFVVGDGSRVGDYGLTVGGHHGRGRNIDRFWFALSYALFKAREFVDLVWLDLWAGTTRQLPEVEYELGLQAASTEAARRANILSARQSTGGQGPEYLEAVVQAAGFDLHIHEWWTIPSPYDPRTYTVVPTIGTVQCGNSNAQCGESTALANTFLGNEPYYIHNRNLTKEAPPIIPSDPDRWRYYLYWSAASFPTHAQVPAARRQELETLLLKICPAQQVLVVLVDYV